MNGDARHGHRRLVARRQVCVDDAPTRPDTTAPTAAPAAAWRPSEAAIVRRPPERWRSFVSLAALVAIGAAILILEPWNPVRAGSAHDGVVMLQGERATFRFADHPYGTTRDGLPLGPSWASAEPAPAAWIEEDRRALGVVWSLSAVLRIDAGCAGTVHVGDTSLAFTASIPRKPDMGLSGTTTTTTQGCRP